MIYAMACGDNQYYPSVRFQLETARKKGKVDKTLGFHLENIDEEFRKKNAEIFAAGVGRRKSCYLWKPYFIRKALDMIEYGDWLIYLDGGSFYYRNSVRNVIQWMEKQHIDMAGSKRGGYSEKDWTKRDVFIALGLDREPYISQTQCHAGLLILKKTAETIKFVEEWLSWCQKYQLITDSPNIYGRDNYEGFREHRHDQSILSLLMGRNGIPCIEQFPFPFFCVYHHSLLLSVKDIKKMQRKKFWCDIWSGIKRHDIGWILYVFREKREEWYWYQWFHQRRMYSEMGKS